MSVEDLVTSSSVLCFAVIWMIGIFPTSLGVSLLPVSSGTLGEGAVPSTFCVLAGGVGAVVWSWLPQMPLPPLGA